MPRYIIKPVKDDDFYVEYSTVVDAPVSWGTRQEFVLAGVEEDRMERADNYGCSALWFYRDSTGVSRRPYDYADEEINISEGFDHNETPEHCFAYIRRENLKEFLTSQEDKVLWDHNHPAVRWEPYE